MLAWYLCSKPTPMTRRKAKGEVQVPYQIQQKYCSCCHRCKNVCPAGAIRFRDGAYWIDPERCISCGLCAKNCHNSIITEIGAIPIAKKPHEPVEKECDLLVVGAGGSGLICAVKTAQETGKKVIVLEKAPKIGGNTWYASGFQPHYSKLQRQAGAPDRREEAIRKFLLDTVQQEDPQLIRNVFYGSERFIDWLMDDCGCQEDFVLGRDHRGVEMACLVNRTGTKWERSDLSIGPGGAGSFLVEKLERQVERLGIEVLTEHRAEHLITDDSGAVTGVVASDGGGEVVIRACKVVLATGCFSYDDKLVEQCCPGFFAEGKVPVHRFSVPTCTGDGIKMAREIGADIDEENTQCLILGPAHHPYAFSLVCLVREPETVLVNQEGNRFGNEQDNTMGMRKLIQRQPGRVCWAIANDALLERQARQLEHSNRDGEAGARVIRKYRQDLEEEIAMGEPVKKADTLAALAVQIGIDPGALEETMAHYNACCAKGYDDAFFKAPEYLTPIEGGPYYAIRCQTFQENAVGGMKINSILQVLRPDGTVIPNLYAVGDNTRGVRLAGDLGPSVVEGTISNLTWCVASGYLAAEQVIQSFSSK